MRSLLQLSVGIGGEVMIPEQMLDAVTSIWVPRTAESVELSVGVHANDVISSWALDSSAPTRLFDGELFSEWRPVTPDLPLGAMFRQAVFLRSTPDTVVWLEGETPDPSTFITRTIVNVRAGGQPLLHQCRPLVTGDAITRNITGRPDCTLVVASGFSYIRS